MCVTNLITFVVCGHSERYFEGEVCESRLSYDENSCSDGRSEIKSDLHEGSYCGDCYIAEMESIRENYTEQYLSAAKDAKTRKWPGNASRRSMDRIEDNMQAAIDEWKSVCFRTDTSDRNEARDYLRSKVEWLGLGSLRMNEKASHDRRCDIKLKRAQAQEKRLYQEWKLKPQKSIIRLFDPSL
jgi:hypothetical protein